MDLFVLSSVSFIFISEAVCGLWDALITECSIRFYAAAMVTLSLCISYRIEEKKTQM